MRQWPLADAKFKDHEETINEIFCEIASYYAPKLIDKDGTYEYTYFVDYLSNAENLGLEIDIFVENKQWSIIRADLVKVPKDFDLKWAADTIDRYFC